MLLFVLSLLAIESAQSAAIGYPYRSLWTYNPIPSSSVHGYLRYLDNNASGGLVGINNQQPIYAVRQIKYFNSATPSLNTFAINNSEEVVKAHEAYLRAASLQQYQNLKSNIDALRADGKEPSAENLSKLQTLEKIAFTSDFSLIAELPEVRSAVQDLEASISGLQGKHVQQNSNQQVNVDQRPGEIKTYVGSSNIPLVAIDETPEQKQAHEDHLRIYNEQIAHLKKLELEHQKYVQEAASKSSILQSSNVDKPNAEQLDNSKALEELERAQQEHLRLWNEAKLRAEQAGYESGENRVNERANKQQISALTNDQNNFNPKPNISNNKNPESQQPNKQFEQQSTKGAVPALEHKQEHLDDIENSENEQLRAATQQQVVDTPEVVRAREEHLRIVNEAISKAQAELQQQQQQSLESSSKGESLGQQIQITQTQGLKSSAPESDYRAEQSFVEETAEVKKAREEHLRLVHEANLRAQYVEQQELKYKHESQTPILKSQYEHQHQPGYQAEISQNVPKSSQHLHLIADAQHLQQQISEAQTVGETAEVQHARDEHLRIFDSIKAHGEQEQAKQNSRSFPNAQNPLLEYAIGEEQLLELERLREAERLQKEQQQLEIDRLREAERLAEEKRQMEAELIRLRLEDEQRLEMERLLEEKRLQQEREELQKQRNGEYQEIMIQTDSADQQTQIAIIPNSNLGQTHSQQNSEVLEQHNHQHANSPFLKINQVSSEPVTHLEYPVNQQSSSSPKTSPIQVPSYTQQQNSIVSNDNTFAGVRYVPSSHHSTGSKHQYIKDDNIKHNYHNAVSSQPADTAVALIALQKATNDHFRAHELALEQLRLARLQNSSIKDCN